MADYIVTALVIALIFFAGRAVFKQRKKGGCSGCSGCGNSHQCQSSKKENS